MKTVSISEKHHSHPTGSAWGALKTARTFLVALVFTLPAFTTPASAPVPDPLSSKLNAPPGKTQQLTTPDQVPEGIAKSDWASIRAAYEAGRHAFQPVEGGWQARNPGQQWTTKFDRRGFASEPKDGAWQWGLELQSYGFAGAERAIRGVPAVKTGGQRLTYDWDAAVQEWFVNDACGLEHGFTVRECPSEIINHKS